MKNFILNTSLPYKLIIVLPQQYQITIRGIRKCCKYIYIRRDEYFEIYRKSWHFSILICCPTYERTNDRTSVELLWNGKAIKISFNSPFLFICFCCCCCCCYFCFPFTKKIESENSIRMFFFAIIIIIIILKECVAVGSYCC